MLCVCVVLADKSSQKVYIIMSVNIGFMSYCVYVMCVHCTCRQVEPDGVHHNECEYWIYVLLFVRCVCVVLADKSSQKMYIMMSVNIGFMSYCVYVMCVRCT